jgi:hypothetical protein
MKRILLAWTGMILPFFALLAQQPPARPVPSAPTDTTHTKQVVTILDAFQQGHFHGHFRSFFMVTDNARQLSDYYALAAGGGLYFNSAPFHGLSVGIGGVFNFNLASSDLGAKDSLTGANNRYEIGLFDVENPENRTDLDRMEEFWLRYERKKLRLTLGKQGIQTPFINFQDGRMRPTVVSGLWALWKPAKTIQVEGGWLWAISPRSTVRWYRVGESVGLYPKGLNPDGSGSGYPENLESKGVGLLGVKRSFGKKWKTQLWNQYVENIFNTVFGQADYVYPAKNGHRLIAGLQLVRQDALRDGGNADARKAYFPKGTHSHIISMQTGWERGPWQVLGAYTRITGEGRFLAPREWGREQFYTFMPRERVEGSGDVHAATCRANWKNKDQKWQIGLAYGHFYLPDVKEVRLNKYAFPAFRQLNLDMRYAFGGVLKGLQAQMLYVWKGRIGEVYGNDKYVINRVNMSHINLILNYTY